MKRYPSISGLRAISCLIVILSHIILRLDALNDTLKHHFVFSFTKIFEDGAFGVNVFFVISGLLITTLLLQEEEKNHHVSLKNFYIRRTLRIFPAYYFMLLVYFVAQLAGFMKLKNVSWLTSITYTTYFYPDTNWLTVHTWSLSVEEHFYLFWPLIFRAGDKLRKNIALWIILAVPVIRLVKYIYNIGWIYDESLFTRIDAIALGCFVALYKDEIMRLLENKWKPLFYGSLIILWLLPPFEYLINKIGLNYLLIPFGTTHGTIGNILIAIIILFSVYKSNGIWFKMLNSRLLNYIGLLSYSLYLWQQLFTLNRPSLWVTKFPQNLVFITLAALFSYYAIEKPFLKLKSVFQSKETAKAD